MRPSSPRLIARIAGLAYLMIFVAAPSGASSATPVTMTINLACDLVVAVLFYVLLEPVDRRLSLIAAFFRVGFVVVMAVNACNYFGVTAWFQPKNSADAFNAGYGIALVPFGLGCILTGYLVYQSTFLPRIVGLLMAVAGAAYLVFLWPAMGNRLFFPWIVVPAVMGEASLTLWLLVVGVNADRWRKQDDLAQANRAARRMSKPEKR